MTLRLENCLEKKIIPNAIDYYLGLVEIEPFSENKEEDDKKESNGIREEI